MPLLNVSFRLQKTSTKAKFILNSKNRELYIISFYILRIENGGTLYYGTLPQITVLFGRSCLRGKYMEKIY